MNGPINRGVSSALPRVFSRRSAILKIVEEKTLGTRLRDKAPVEWPRSEGGDPTEGSMLGRLLWKPTPKRGPLHESHWTKPVEKGKVLSKLQTAHVSMTAARESRSWRASEATPDRGLGCAPIH